MSDHPRSAIPWPQIGAAIGVLVFLGTVITFLTGGLHPQWQNDIAELRASNAALQADIKTAIAASAADRAVLSARIDADNKLLTSRLDAMWRTDDYTVRDTHLSRLDTVFEALRDRVTKLEYDDQRLAEKLQNLTTVPTARTK